MAISLNLSLTDELRDFVDEVVGDGTLYATPARSYAICSAMKKRQADAE